MPLGQRGDPDNSSREYPPLSSSRLSSPLSLSLSSASFVLDLAAFLRLFSLLRPFLLPCFPCSYGMRRDSRCKIHSRSPDYAYRTAAPRNPFVGKVRLRVACRVSWKRAVERLGVAKCQLVDSQAERVTWSCSIFFF